MSLTVLLRPLLLTAALLAAAMPAAQDLTRAQLDSLNDNAYRIYSRDLPTADSLFDRAARTARKRGWVRQEAAARKHLGITRFLRGNYAAALPEYQRALGQYESLGDEAGQAAVLVEMGNFFKKRQENDRAAEMLQRATVLAGRAGEERLRSNALDITGRIHYGRGELDRAEELFNEVLGIRRRIRDTVGLAYVFDNLAALASQRGQTALALAYLDSTVLIRDLLDDRQGMAIAINNQGEALLASGDTAAAVPYLEKSLTLSTAVSFTDLQQWTMNLLSQAYEASGRDGSALAMQRNVQAIKDSLYDAATSRNIAEMQEKYEAEKRQAQLELREAQLATRTAYLIAAGLALLLLAGGVVWLVYRQRHRREALRRRAAEQLRDDRLRISRDLHDHLGAELSIIASDLNRLDGQLPERPLAGVTLQVRYAMEQMRDTIWAVRLEAADYTALQAKLRQFAEKLGHPGISVTVAPALADQPLEPNAVLQLYRFTQEALNNAVKYAAAQSIRVRFEPGRLSIRDDGTGFDPATVDRGYGLSSLHERAAELGGRVEIRSGAGAGTRITLRSARIR